MCFVAGGPDCLFACRYFRLNSLTLPTILPFPFPIRELVQVRRFCCSVKSVYLFPCPLNRFVLVWFLLCLTRLLEIPLHAVGMSRRECGVAAAAVRFLFCMPRRGFGSACLGEVLVLHVSASSREGTLVGSAYTEA